MQAYSVGAWGGGSPSCFLTVRLCLPDSAGDLRVTCEPFVTIFLAFLLAILFNEKRVKDPTMKKNCCKTVVVAIVYFKIPKVTCPDSDHLD